MQTITITQQEVLVQARKRLHYKGESLKEGDKIQLATTLQASQDEDDVLETYAQKAAEKMADALNRTASTALSLSSGTYTFSITPPSNYDTNQDPLIKGGIFSYMVNRVIFEWLNITAPELAKSYYELAAESEADIIRRIAKRKKPTS